ncbi:MAG TPA: CHAD domain-containing protein [Xanthomonadales bacterium]|nr:CHAD domain-containing protein [Xanthomonadales bacterium]
MTFRIDLTRPVPAELERIVGEQLDAACTLLRAPAREHDVHEAVHEARRAIRRIRATLQLLRPALGGAYADVVAPYRAAGRALSVLRDAQSAIEGVERVAKRSPDAIPDAVRAALVARLSRNRDALLRRRGAVLGEVADRLEAARDDVATWVEAADHATLWRGVRRGYARAARAMRRARQQRSEALLHRWRQRTRDHWLQLELVSGVWQAVVGAQAEAVHRLAQRLGAERDLLLVTQRLERSRRAGKGRIADAALAQQLGGVRNAMLERSFATGARVFAEQPRALARRLAAYREARLANP